MKIPCIAALLSVAAFEAQAAGHLAEISVIDQATGAVLPTYYAAGETWVAGTPGARYAIRVTNSGPERLLAVMSVDGVNVLTGDTASWSQGGYVYGPGTQYAVAGWRKSDREVAAFEFTSVPDAYATRTGRPANVGVIGVALFRERPAPPPPLAFDFEARRAEAPEAQAGAPAPMAQPAPIPPPLAASAAAPAARARQDAALQSLGTGHGAREYSYTYQVNFERLRPTPDEVIRIRYDSLPNLVARGIVPRAPHAAPNPFPDAPLARYVPDPPGN